MYYRLIHFHFAFKLPARSHRPRIRTGIHFVYFTSAPHCCVHFVTLTMLISAVCNSSWQSNYGVGDVWIPVFDCRNWWDRCWGLLWGIIMIFQERRIVETSDHHYQTNNISTISCYWFLYLSLLYINFLTFLFFSNVGFITFHSLDSI